MAKADGGQGTSQIRGPEGPVTRLLVAGDLFVPRPVPGAPPPWQDLIPLIEAHDIAVVNVECALSASLQRIVKEGPAMVAPASLAHVARAGGFTVASLANNHVLDAGFEGLLDTMNACEGAGLTTVGAGATLEEARRPLLLASPAGTLAILARAEREFSIAGRRSPGAAPLDPWETVSAVIRARREADLVVVLVHGGNEMVPLPRPGLVAACRAIVDAGADTVVCHHSHVPGPWEVYRGAPVVYGTGNLLFPVETPQSRGWYEGYLVSLELDGRGAVAVRVLPYVQDVSPPEVRLLTPEDASGFLARIDASSSVLAEDGRLEQAWIAQCRELRPHLLSMLLDLSRFERGLLRLGIWPSWRHRRRSLPALYDLIACESHREAAEAVLAQESRLGLVGRDSATTRGKRTS